MARRSSAKYRIVGHGARARTGKARWRRMVPSWRMAGGVPLFKLSTELQAFDNFYTTASSPQLSKMIVHVTFKIEGTNTCFPSPALTCSTRTFCQMSPLHGCCGRVREVVDTSGCQNTRKLRSLHLPPAANAQDRGAGKVASARCRASMQYWAVVFHT